MDIKPRCFPLFILLFVSILLGGCSQDNTDTSDEYASIRVAIPNVSERSYSQSSGVSAKASTPVVSGIPSEVTSIVIELLENNVVRQSADILSVSEVTFSVLEGDDYTIRGRAYNGSELLFSGEKQLPIVLAGSSVSVNLSLADQILLTLLSFADREISSPAEVVAATLSGLTDTSLRWLVNDVEGGSVEFGTIDANGLYTPPTILPTNTTITITSEPLMAPSFANSVSFDLYPLGGLNTAPVIILLGNATEIFTQVMGDFGIGGIYIDAGATANDIEEGNLTSDIVTVNLVDTSVVGSYSVTYNVTDSAGAAAVPVVRTVNVVAGNFNPPVITLIGNSTETVVLNSSYSDAGATASDVEDGDLSGDLVIVNSVDESIIGSYSVTYNVQDSGSLSATQVVRTVNVVSGNLNPVITLIGNSTETVVLNASYSDAGATVNDVEDGNISSDLVIINSVDINTLGSYSVTYDVQDSGSLSATQVVRTVNVIAAIESSFVNKRISLSMDGSAANDNSVSSRISADGRYVVYGSQSTDIVSGITNANNGYIFRYDRQTNTTLHVSIASDGGEPNGFNSLPDVSDDGRFVVFVSNATNLIVADTNNQHDIFLRDVQNNITTRISLDSAGSESNGFSNSPKISADGRYIVFQSLASNLIAADNNGATDIFLHDTTDDSTIRISVDSFANEANGSSDTTVISADGRYIAYRSSASNLVAGDSNGNSDIFRFDTVTLQTLRVNTDAGGVEANDHSYYPSISNDGTLLSFHSQSNNLVAADANIRQDVFVKNIQTNAISRVSVDSAGLEANDGSVNANISADGLTIIFQSIATNLTIDNTAGSDNVFHHTLATGKTVLVSSPVPNGSFNGSSSVPALTADGQIITYDSSNYHLTGGDSNARIDIFVAEVDSDADGVSDVDESAFGSQALLVESDHDNDGVTSDTERYFGSNPLDNSQQPITDYTLTELTSMSEFTGADLITSADMTLIESDASVEYTLPFTLPFYGLRINTLNAGSNSDIKLRSGIAGSSSGYSLTTDSRQGLPFIGIWNDDLDARSFGGGLNIQAKTTPARVIFNWDTETYDDGGGNLLNNFETVLYPNGYIIFRYNSFNAVQVNDSGSGVSLSNGVDYVNLTTMVAPVHSLAGRVFLFEPQHSADLDNDGIIDSDEAGFNTTVGDDDSDNDGFKDGWEVYILGSDPMNSLDPIGVVLL